MLSLAFALPSHASATPPSQAIRNELSGLCTQVDPNNTGPDIQLIQADCANPGAQWRFWPLGNGNYHIQNALTGNCMRALSDTDFAVVDTIDCTGISNETWSIQVDISSVTPNLNELRSHVSGGNRCLDVQEGSRASGTPIDIFHCTTDLSRNQFNWAQIFTLR